MNIIKYTLLLLSGIPFLLNAEQTMPTGFPSMPSSIEVVHVDKTIIIDSDFDGEGKYFKPTLNVGDGSQREDQDPVFSIVGDGITFKNVHYEGADGIHVLGRGVVIENVWNWNVGEDAITIKPRTQSESYEWDAEIRNFGARNAKDKAIQIISNTKVLVENCYFENVSKAYRFKENHRGVFRNNMVLNCKTPVKGNGTNAILESYDNVFINIRTTQRVENGSVVNERNNNSTFVKKSK